MKVTLQFVRLSNCWGSRKMTSPLLDTGKRVAAWIITLAAVSSFGFAFANIINSMKDMITSVQTEMRLENTKLKQHIEIIELEISHLKSELNREESE